MPLVSLVTPTFNQSNYIKETIESVLRQDYPNVEYIVVDDGSTDGTSEILDKYSCKIKIVRQNNSGQGAALNKGWELCSGDYIGYLSSDDLLDSSAIQKLVDFMLRDSEIVCAYPNSNLIDEKSKIIKNAVCKDFSLKEVLIKQECWIGPGALLRRDVYDKVGGWKTNLKLAPDREYWLRVSNYGKIKMLKECLAGYRLHRESISYREISEATSREYLWVLDRYFESGGVPEWALNSKNEAYGYANLIVARNCFRSGKIRRGFKIYREAIRLNENLLSWPVWLTLMRTILSKPVRTIYSRFSNAIRIGR